MRIVRGVERSAVTVPDLPLPLPWPLFPFPCPLLLLWADAESEVPAFEVGAAPGAVNPEIRLTAAIATTLRSVVLRERRDGIVYGPFVGLVGRSRQVSGCIDRLGTIS